MFKTLIIVRSRLIKAFTEVAKDWSKGLNKFFVSNGEIIDFTIKKNKITLLVDKTNLTKIDRVYIRYPDKTRVIMSLIASFCITQGIGLVEKKRFERLIVGKPSQLIYLIFFNIKVPETHFFTYDHLLKAERLFQKHERWVVKSSSGSKGDNVFLLDNISKFKTIQTQNPLTHFLFQEFIPNNCDYRILVIEGRIKSVCRRTRSSSSVDFRNNTHLGASENFLPISFVPKTLQLKLYKCAQYLPADIIGFDFIIKDNSWFCIEFNVTPGITNNSPESEALQNYLLK